MVKIKDARYCNLKLFLMFLVIYGHLIEPEIRQSPVLTVQYRWIYLIHMPLFSFLSGLFLNNAKGCRTQLEKMFPLYVLLQTMAVLLGKGAGLLTPWWHLWYLLSCSLWLCLAWIWFQTCKGQGRFLILTCSVLVGCLAGCLPFVGRAFSLSRTLVFFPYFWAGLILRPSVDWQKLRKIGAAALALVLCIMFSVGRNIPVTFLYQATPYEMPRSGMLLRLLCYLLAGSLGLFLLSFAPGQRFPFTKVGADTLPAYLLHGPMVLYLREWNIPWQFDIMLSIAILCAADLLTRWHRGVYGIIPAEKGG